MKKLSFIFVLCVFLLLSSACGEKAVAFSKAGSEATGTASKAEAAPEKDEAAGGGFTISYKTYAVVNDSDGDPAVRVVFTLENGSGNAASFDDVADISAYQKGGSLKTAVPEDKKEADGAETEATAPGSTTEAAFTFVTSGYSEVTVKLVMKDGGDSMTKKLPLCYRCAFGIDYNAK